MHCIINWCCIEEITDAQLEQFYGFFTIAVLLMLYQSSAPWNVQASIFNVNYWKTWTKRNERHYHLLCWSNSFCNILYLFHVHCSQLVLQIRQIPLMMVKTVFVPCVWALMEQTWLLAIVRGTSGEHSQLAAMAKVVAGGVSIYIYLEEVRK